MPSLGFGFGLGNLGGSWVSGNAEARNGLWYGDWTKGQFALNGAPVGFSQLGTASRAGGAYETQSDASLDFLGANVPRLADYSTGSRRWLMEGGVTNLSDPLSSVTMGSNTTLTLQPDEVGPDGATGSVYRLEMPADVDTYIRLITLTYSTKHTGSVYVKSAGAGLDDFEFANAIAGGAAASASESWTRAHTSFDDGNAFTVNNGDDSYAVDILIAFPMFNEGDLSSYVAPGATRAPELFTEDLSDFDLSDGVWVYFEGELNAVAGSFDRLFETAESSARVGSVVYQESGGNLRAEMFSGGALQAREDHPYTLGDTVSLAVRFENNNFAYVVNGSLIGSVDTSAVFDAPDAFAVADSLVSGNKPASLTPAKMWIAPASAYSVAGMEAKTAPPATPTATLDSNDTGTNLTAQTEYTFSSASEATSEQLIVALTGIFDDGSTGNLTTTTTVDNDGTTSINSISANDSQEDVSVGIAWKVGPLSSPDVSILDHNQTAVEAAFCTMVVDSADTLVDSGTNSPTQPTAFAEVTVNTVAGGFVAAVFMANHDSDDTEWTGATELHDTPMVDSRFSVAYIENTDGNPVTISAGNSAHSNNGIALAVASFGPIEE